MKKYALALVASLLATSLWAQPVTNLIVSGNECWSAGQGPGGPSQFLCINVARNSASALPLTIAGSFTIGSTAAQVGLTTGGNLIITAQPAVATITMPPNPIPDGAIVGFCNPTAGAFATNAVTAVANANQTMNTAITLTTLAAATCQKVQWSLATATWYRIQ